jgi:hypothetical protein
VAENRHFAVNTTVARRQGGLRNLLLLAISQVNQGVRGLIGLARPMQRWSLTGSLVLGSVPRWGSPYGQLVWPLCWHGENRSAIRGSAEHESALIDAASITKYAPVRRGSTEAKPEAAFVKPDKSYDGIPNH